MAAGQQWVPAAQPWRQEACSVAAQQGFLHSVQWGKLLRLAGQWGNHLAAQ